jgi:hypothetical protein
VHRRYDARVHTDLVPGHETVVKPTSPSKEAFEAAAWTVAHAQRIASRQPLGLSRMHKESPEIAAPEIAPLEED